MVFRTPEGDDAFVVDPVPRLIERAEWERLERGLAQRVRALNAFLADAYGERQIVDAGRIPERVIDGAVTSSPMRATIPVPGGVYIGVAGLDVVRVRERRVPGARGQPAHAVRGSPTRRARPRSRTRSLPWTPRRADDRAAPRRAAGGDAARRGARGRRRAVHGAPLRRPGEQRLVGAPPAGASARHPDRDRPRAGVCARAGCSRASARPGARAPSTWSTAARTRIGCATSTVRRPGSPSCCSSRCAAGRVACVNAFGTGIADDKLVHAYVEEMIRFYLGEEPADPVGPDVRPRRAVRPRHHPGAHGRAGRQAARRLRRRGRRGLRRMPARRTGAWRRSGSGPEPEDTSPRRR